MKTKLNIGCGSKKLRDHHNVDILPLCQPDEVVDLEVIPWPWKNNSFKVITAKDILEHLGSTPKHFLSILKEMYRVSRPNAIWDIAVPHWRCDIAFDDPTHVRVITARTFDLFNQHRNVELLKLNQADSPLGLSCRIDLEIVGVTFDVIPMWQEMIRNGTLGKQEFERNMNHLNNVCQGTIMQVKVHKPERYEDWIEQQMGG